MSFVIAVPEALTMAASDLANIGSTINAANAAAALPTTGVVAAAADEVSAAVAALFGSYAQSYQAFGAQLSAFHGPDRSGHRTSHQGGRPRLDGDLL